MSKRSTKEDIQKLLKLHSMGLKNRAIARELNLSHRTVAYHVQKNGLIANGSRVYHLDKVNESQARCSKCKEVYDLCDWPTAREGKKYPYKLSYCRFCKIKQYNDNINSDVNKYLRDRFNKVKLRCKYSQTEFNLDLEFIKLIYEKQKGICFYTDEIMETSIGNGRKRNSLSIDRVDPKKGYVKDNIVLCCLRFNTVKQDLSEEEIKKWMPPIYERIQMWRRRGIFVFDCNQTGREF